MASSFLPVVLENLNSLIQAEVGLLWGVDKEMKKLSSTLSTIEAVLEDAEQKQLDDKAIQDWLRKLKGVAYEVDDILDDCATEALRWKTKDHTSTSLKKVSTSLSYPFENIKFRHEIGNRMKEITEELGAIAEERKFHLREAVAGKSDEFANSRETCSFLTQPEVYGRDEEKQKIVKVLVEDICDRDEVSVYPIIGMGGLGKTTLAQMAFNDERVKSHFDLKIWVYVSQDFDVKRVIQATIESATRKASEASDLESLQRELRDILNGKRFLIVLDDVWNDNQEKWDRLKCALACGSKGASVVITTRLEKVSAIARTIPPHHLSFLSEDDCWLLFRQRAFGNGNQERQNLVDIGKEIVKKCGGVPLAAKALGGLLRFKSEESEWILVKESEVWDMPHGENSILPALRLSYSNLSLELRRCFAYCAVFSKGCAIFKENLIRLWMANGYISCKGKLELEDIGDHIWNELCWRSFFQDVEKHLSGIILFKMHDLMHDLAQSVMGDECHIMENKSSSCIPKQRLHHVSLLGDTKNTIVFPKSLQSVESLRSILLQYREPFHTTHDDRIDQFSCDFKKLCLLRAFDASGAKMSQLSSLIGNLKHLRFLNLSGTHIQTLPKSICSLLNLQTLNLNYCYKLRRLPKNLKDLRSLRHLYLKSCREIHHMPPKLGQLTLLKTLSLFCVGKSGDQRLAELQHLDLGGELCIKHLERVRNSMDAKEANLDQKQKLRIIKLDWSRNSDWESQANVEQLLEALRPHQNVEELFIHHYKSSRFPLWMSDSTLKNVVSIVLFKCSNCLMLPLFGQLPFLQHLAITGMDYVEYIDNDFSGGGPVRGFPSLEELYICDLPNLKGLSMEEGRDLLPRLRNISIENCPKLTLPCLSSSETLTLYIYGCNNSNVMLSSISNLNCLTSLTVCRNDDAISFPEEMLQNLTSLESLEINMFSKLKLLPSNLSSLVSLKSMKIKECHELESLPEHGLQSLNSLQHLEINHCNSLSSLSESFGHLTALEVLDVRGCPKLVATPESIEHLGSLRDLTLHGRPSSWSLGKVLICEELKTLSESLQHVTSLQSLSLSDYPELTSLPEWLGNFSSLQSLSICHCPKIQSLPEALQHVTSLQSLSIHYSRELTSLPKWLGNFSSLQSLSIGNCPKIQSLPQSIQSLTKLKTLSIWRCGPELVRRCQKGNGEDWYKIAHVPEVYVPEDDVDPLAKPKAFSCWMIK